MKCVMFSAAIAVSMIAHNAFAESATPRAYAPAPVVFDTPAKDE